MVPMVVSIAITGPSGVGLASGAGACVGAEGGGDEGAACGGPGMSRAKANEMSMGLLYLLYFGVERLKSSEESMVPFMGLESGTGRY
jgi:hypothetical protein